MLTKFKIHAVKTKKGVTIVFILLLGEIYYQPRYQLNMSRAQGTDLEKLLLTNRAREDAHYNGVDC